MSLIEHVRKKQKQKIKKVAILGPTGAGKTTFIKGFFGEIDTTDVKRRRELESQVDNTYVLLSSDKEMSTTTVSMNTLRVKLILSKSNRLYYSEPNEKILPLEEVEETHEINFVDNPGQERFIFMSEITIGGADGVIIVIDGSMSVSISALPKFLEVVRVEEERSNKIIPKLVFVNKADLAKKSSYLGSDVVLRLFSDLIEKYNIILFETTNKDFVTFEVPLRTLLQLLDK